MAASGRCNGPGLLGCWTVAPQAAHHLVASHGSNQIKTPHTESSAKILKDMFCEDQTKVRAPAYLQVRQLDLQVFQQLQSDLTMIRIRTSDRGNPLRYYHKWYNLMIQMVLWIYRGSHTSNNTPFSFFHSVPRTLWDQQTSSLFTHQIPSSSSPS